MLQVPLNPNDTAPQLLHAFIFDLKELKNMITKINIKRGIRNNKIKILPRKLIKKLIPKIETRVSKINE